MTTATAEQRLQLMTTAAATIIMQTVTIYI